MDHLLERFHHLDSASKAKFFHNLFLSSINNKPDSSQNTNLTIPQDQGAIELSNVQKERNSAGKDHDSYTDEFRKEVVELARTYNNNRKACREIKEKYASQRKFQNLTEKSIRDWRNDPKFNLSYEEDNANKTRIQKRDIKGRFQGMEEDLIKEIKEKRAEGRPVNRNWIKSRAKDLTAEPNFQASDGWLNNFIKRWKLSLRVPTKVMQKISENYAFLAKDFIEKVRAKRSEYVEKKSLEVIFGNVDQVPFEFDMSRRSTYDFVGKKEIKLLKTTGAKQRFTVQLCVLANGQFLPPVFVFKSKGKVPTSLQIKFQNRALLYCNKTGWVTEQIMLDFISKIWLNLNINENTQKPFLILDKFSIHQMPSVKNKLNKQSLYEYVPAGCTGLLQPLDTHINKPIKDRVRTSFEQWFDQYGSKEINQTKSGYLRPPSIENTITWILNACEGIEEKVIKNSFKHCAINHDLYGEENHMINPKLLRKEELKKYLDDTFRQTYFHPYDDKAEIQSILHSEEGLTYDFIEESVEMKEDQFIQINQQEQDEEADNESPDHDPFLQDDEAQENIPIDQHISSIQVSSEGNLYFFPIIVNHL